MMHNHAARSVGPLSRLRGREQTEFAAQLIPIHL